ncbi:MAG: PrpR N-terminal domain-containing protein, partial [Defluviitaleaceae bacterium]|nr:PrpR N-terminal domain-containing protein [Defluviitaleaceae bacterium]
MDRIKILAIAPYQGLKELFEEVAASYGEIELHCHIADMHEGLALTSSLNLEDYSAIISRAGTAELLEKISPIPVVDVGITVYDMLRAVSLLQSYKGKFAVVGFSAITDYAVILNDILQSEIQIFTVRSQQEILECMERLKSQGFGLVIGDMITVTNARRSGLNTILVTSNRESVNRALQECIRWQKKNSSRNHNIHVYEKLLQSVDGGFFVFDTDKKCFLEIRREYLITENDISVVLNRYASDIFSGKLRQIVRQYGGVSYRIQFCLTSILGQEVCICHFKPIQTLTKDEQSMVSYQNLDDAPTVNLETFKSSSLTYLRTIDTVKEFAKNRIPVIISGQRGCGKDSYAHALYRFGGYTSKPMITIDCAQYTPKKWAALMESENSPLGESSCTVYFKEVYLLSSSIQSQLKAFFEDTHIHKRNQLIFSHIPGASAVFDEGCLYHYIRNTMQAHTLSIPTLNERLEDIPNLVALYLNQMGTTMAKQVVGMHPSALSALQEFYWDDNLDQLKRIIQELVTITNSSYISEDLTREVLSKEQALAATQANPSQIDLSGTLDEIIDKVVKTVLKQENMNQSKAAKRLDISRS